MRKYVCIINGSGGVGKDTFIEMVSRYVPSDNYSSVTKVKQIATFAGWNGEKSERDRKFLSDIKFLTTAYNDMPLKAMIERIKNFIDNDSQAILFLHVREPEEIERLKNAIADREVFRLNDVLTLLVTRDSVPQIISNPADGGVFDYEYDYKIENNGDLEDLDYAARKFIVWIAER